MSEDKKIDMIKCAVVLALFATLMAVNPGRPFAGEKRIFGWLEKVKIYPGNIVLDAKLDTGAKNSSLNASHIQEFTRNGNPWVRFQLQDQKGDIIIHELPVVRMTRIKRHQADSLARYVVRLEICLGSTRRTVEVNLTDRSDFKYPMLIGRSFMRPTVIVDPSAQFTSRPACPGFFAP